MLVEIIKRKVSFENGPPISKNMATRQPSLKTVFRLYLINTMIDFVEIKHTDGSYSEPVSFQKLAFYLNKYGCQAAIFQKSFLGYIQ